MVGKAKRVKMIWKGWQVIDEIFDDLGFNPGKDFQNWLAEFLEDNGIKTVADLNDHFVKLPSDLIIREGIAKTLIGLKPRLAIISADLTTETKVEFPRMASLFDAMFNSSRHLHDYDFLLKNPDYRLLIEKIDIGNHDWLNFGITDEAKLDLFKRGADAADRFLRQFDWSNYKKIREQLINNIDE